jgi:hypothetical protein
MKLRFRPKSFRTNFFTLEFCTNFHPKIADNNNDIFLGGGM